MYFFFIVSVQVIAIKPKSVNVALETVFEFDKNIKSSELDLIDRIQTFLAKVSSTLRNGRREYKFIKRDNKFVKDIIIESIQIILSFKDEDLEIFPEIIKNELETYFIINHKHNLNINKIKSNEETLAHDVKVIKNQLKNALDFINNKDTKLNKYNFLNSFFKQKSNDKLNELLQNLKTYAHKYRRRNHDLRQMFTEGFKELYVKYYVNLDENVKNLLKSMIGKIYNRMVINIDNDVNKKMVPKKNLMEYRHKFTTSQYDSRNVKVKINILHETDEPASEENTTPKQLLQTLWVEEKDRNFDYDSDDQMSEHNIDKGKKRKQKRKKVRKNVYKLEPINLNHDPNKPHRFVIESRTKTTTPSLYKHHYDVTPNNKKYIYNMYKKPHYRVENFDLKKNEYLSVPSHEEMIIQDMANFKLKNTEKNNSEYDNILKTNENLNKVISPENKFNVSTKEVSDINNKTIELRKEVENVTTLLQTEHKNITADNSKTFENVEELDQSHMDNKTLFGSNTIPTIEHKLDFKEETRRNYNISEVEQSDDAPSTTAENLTMNILYEKEVNLTLNELKN